MNKKARSNLYFVKRLSKRLTSKTNKDAKDFVPTHEFIDGLQLSFRQGKNLAKLYTVINHLRYGEELPAKNRDHQINGKKKNQKARECHVEPDWLFIYRFSENHQELILIGLDVGSHSHTGMTEDYTTRAKKFSF